MQHKQDKPAFAISRRRRNGIVFLCLLILTFLVWLDHSLVGHRPYFELKSEEQTKDSDVEKYHGKDFTVVNVIDGDTFDIDIPDGRYERTRVRLLGIDTPETSGEESGVLYFGQEAAEFTKKLILGKSITIYLDSPNPTRGKYGRLLAYVKLPDGRFLNEILLTEGYAYADPRFSHSFYNKYRQLQEAARSAKKGLWQNVTPDKLPQWLQ
jgi:endonuclease YncB( thermonuclease family)